MELTGFNEPIYEFVDAFKRGNLDIYLTNIIVYNKLKNQELCIIAVSLDFLIYYFLLLCDFKRGIDTSPTIIVVAKISKGKFIEAIPNSILPAFSPLNTSLILLAKNIYAIPSTPTVFIIAPDPHTIKGTTLLVKLIFLRAHFMQIER